MQKNIDTSPNYILSKNYDYSFIYCIEVQDPEELHGLRHMLATEELFLNFTGEIKGNTLYDLVYKHILGCVSTIKVTPQNKYLKSVNGILYSKDGKTLIACPAMLRTEVLHIPDGTEFISPYAFSGNCNIRELHFPDSLRHIGTKACSDMAGLKRIEFGLGIEHIGSLTETSIFAHCDNLESVEIPEQVQTIGASAFARCHNLRHVVLHGSLTHICEKAFLETDFRNVVLPPYVSDIGQDAFSHIQSITVDRSWTIPSGLIKACLGYRDKWSLFNFSDPWILRINDEMTGKTFCLPRIMNPDCHDYNIEMLSFLWDSGNFCDKHPAFFVLDGHLDADKFARYDVLISSYKVNPSDEVYKILKNSVREIALDYKTALAENTVSGERCIARLTDLRSLGFLSFM